MTGRLSGCEYGSSGRPCRSCSRSQPEPWRVNVRHVRHCSDSVVGQWLRGESASMRNVQWWVGLATVDTLASCRNRNLSAAGVPGRACCHFRHFDVWQVSLTTAQPRTRARWLKLATLTDGAQSYRSDVLVSCANEAGALHDSNRRTGSDNVYSVPQQCNHRLLSAGR